MEKNLYIDASHPNETRIVLKSNSSIEEYEFENQDSLNSLENYHLDIGLADLTDFQRDGENLVEYKKEFKSILI